MLGVTLGTSVRCDCVVKVEGIEEVCRLPVDVGTLELVTVASVLVLCDDSDVLVGRVAGDWDTLEEWVVEVEVDHDLRVECVVAVEATVVVCEGPSRIDDICFDDVVCDDSVPEVVPLVKVCVVGDVISELGDVLERMVDTG